MKKIKNFWAGLDRPYTVKDYVLAIIGSIAFAIVVYGAALLYIFEVPNKIKDWLKEKFGKTYGTVNCKYE